MAASVAVIMSKFDDFYTILDSHLRILESQFIARFLPANPLTPPSDYEHFVKAYCILSHAAIEEYFESVSLGVMSQSLDEWQNHRKNTDTLATLISCFGLKITIDDNENNRETKVFDYLRAVFDEAKRKLSQEINENHGISAKYLRKLMIPVAISIVDDVSLLNSLKQLAKARGEYAHKQLIKTVLAPEDAKSYVEDCLKICEDIRAKANSKFTPPPTPQ